MIIEENNSLNKKDLNTLYTLSKKEYGDYSFIKIIDSDKYLDKCHGSDNFRFNLLKNGYKINILYDVYHQGWECDEYATHVEKNNKKYWVETNHDSFVFVEQENIILKLVNVFKRKINETNKN